MFTVATKRKLNTKLIKEKYAALNEVEEESLKPQVAMKYDIPKNTLSIWIKNKEKNSNLWRRKETNQNVGNLNKKHLQTWMIFFSNGSPKS